MMKDGIRAAMSEETERETVKRMGQRASAEKTDKLEACPWCLGPARLTSTGNGDAGDGYMWRIACAEDNDCAVAPEFYYESEELAVTRWNTRSRASVAAPQLQETYEDPHPGYDCGGTCAVHGIAPKFNVPFEVWWKGQIARDFIQSALTDLEKISGPKLLAGEGSFAAEATAASAARRSLDSALSILDDAKRFGPSPVAATVDAETLNRLLDGFTSGGDER